MDVWRESGTCAAVKGGTSARWSCRGSVCSRSARPAVTSRGTWSRRARKWSYDLSHEHRWDIVSYAHYDVESYLKQRQEHLRRLNNGYWFTHRACGLRARVVSGTVYEIPAAIGPVDVTTFGAVLVHLRDPFLALERALQLTRETVVVTEPVHMNFLPAFLSDRFGRPTTVFLPRHRACEPKEAWWIITPRAVLQFVATLGFESASVSYYLQRYRGRRRLCYTVVAQRTASTVSKPAP
jgi:hypothetical protein